MNWRLLLAIVLVTVGTIAALISAYAITPALAGLLGGAALVALGLLGTPTVPPREPPRDPLTLQRRGGRS